MSQKILTYTAAGLSLVTTPVWAQEFYVGATVGQGDFTIDSPTNDFETSTRSLLAGVRYNIGENVYLGAEMQSRSSNFLSGYWGPDGNFTQLELHLGYQLDSVTLFGFVGTGSNNLVGNTEVDAASTDSILGVGAEFSVSDSLSLRVETEIMGMTVDDSCYSPADVENAVTSVGVIFSF